MEATPYTSFDYLGPPIDHADALSTLGGSMRRWFRSRYREATAVQRLAWPAIVAGRNVLIASPTGTGKTLAAFVPILHQLHAERCLETVRCLYIAPLKALTHDTLKTLRLCRIGLARYQPEWGRIRMAARTGDSTAASRRRLRTQASTILLTTPESVAILLSQHWAEELFADLRWLVVDEVHAVMASKRGADLSISMERLHAISRQAVQRIGISATCSPVENVAHFLVGQGRDCALAQIPDESDFDLRVERIPNDESFLHALMDRLEPEMHRQRTILVFADTRSLAEKLCWRMGLRWPQWKPQIAVHHSSLARSVRRNVERRLKRGALRLVISSSSLELGIDVGPVDLTVLVRPPGDAVRLLQRLGRAGHGPRRRRRGLVMVSTPAEVLEAAVTVASCRTRTLQPVRMVRHPLDVLCQQLLGMAAQRAWEPDEAFAIVRRALPYAELLRRDFDDCMNYLLGRQRDGQRWLPPRLVCRAGRFELANASVARVLRQNLGTIIAEDPWVVRKRGQVAQHTKRVGKQIDGLGLISVGEVQSLFAERLQPGDRFVLGGTCLQVHGADAQEVIVEETGVNPVVPRWGGEPATLSADLAQRIYEARVSMGDQLRDGAQAFEAYLRDEYDLPIDATSDLAAYLQQQESSSEIPNEEACLIECVAGGAGNDYYIHTPLNRAANEAILRVLLRRLQHLGRRTVDSLSANLGLRISLEDLTNPLRVMEWRSLLAADGFERDLAATLEGSEIMREQFRRVALTGLMLLRQPQGGRRRVGGHDWAERRLYDKVKAMAPEFVLLRQAEREVQREVCDGDSAQRYLVRVGGSRIQCRWLPQPSPFAQFWTQPTAGPPETIGTLAEILQRFQAELTTSRRMDAHP